MDHLCSEQDTLPPKAGGIHRIDVCTFVMFVVGGGGLTLGAGRPLAGTDLRVATKPKA
jgi:hypothetical protein